MPEACSRVRLSPGALGELFSGNRQSDARVANPSLLEGTEEAWATEGTPPAQPGGSFYISQRSWLEKVKSPSLRLLSVLADSGWDLENAFSGRRVRMESGGSCLAVGNQLARCF